MKTKLVVAVLISLVAVTVTMLVVTKLCNPRGPTVSSFRSSGEVLTAISNLPVITYLGPKVVSRDWAAYITLAKNLRETKPEIVISALENAQRGGASMDESIKVVLLFRVCFECSPGLRRPATYGGWVSRTAQVSGRTNYSENWPVEYRFQRFYLIDSLDGYLGRPYDPVAEFRWRLVNCKWRNL